MLRSHYNLRSLKRKAEAEADTNTEVPIAPIVAIAPIPSNILQISICINNILKIVFDSAAPQILISKMSDIKYRIGRNSILSNTKLLAMLFSMNVIVPIKYNISSDIIIFYIIFNYRHRLTNNICNCLTITLKKHNSSDEISSIVPNIWESCNAPIVNEMIGNVFNVNISDGEKDTFIITNIDFRALSIGDSIGNFLKKILILNINTLPLPIFNTICKIKFKFGDILSNLNFIYQWFNILSSINCNSTIIDDNTIVFKIVLFMRDIRPQLVSMMTIYLKKYNGQVNSIKTNIILGDILPNHDAMANNIFECTNPDSTVADSTVADSTVTDSTVADSTVADSTVADSNIWVVTQILFNE